MSKDTLLKQRKELEKIGREDLIAEIDDALELIEKQEDRDAIASAVLRAVTEGVEGYNKTLVEEIGKFTGKINEVLKAVMDKDPAVNITVPEIKLPELTIPEPKVEKVELDEKSKSQLQEIHQALSKIALGLEKKNTDTPDYTLEIDPEEIRGEKGEPGAPGRDGIEITPEQIVAKLNTLQGVLNLEVLKDYKKLLGKAGNRVGTVLSNIYQIQGLVLEGIQVGQTIKWDGKQFVPADDNEGAGGGSGVWGAITGDITTQADLQRELITKAIIFG